MTGVHSFGVAVEPLKDKQLLPAFAGSQDQVAVGAMCPDAECASSNLLWQGQRPEIQIRATGVGAGLPSGGLRNRPAPNHERPKQMRCGNVRRCGGSLAPRSLPQLMLWLASNTRR